MKTLITLFLFTAALWVSAAWALTVPEKFVYEVSWKGVTVGSSVQEVTAQDDEVRIVNTIRSSGLLSTMFAIDDRTESVIPRGTSTGVPKCYQEKINEGDFHTRKEARFNFANLTVDSKDLLKKTEKQDSISANTHDSLSSIYFIRSKELTPGQTISFEIYDFKRLWKTEVHVVKREEIRTPVGKFKTLVVTSNLTFNGVASKVGSATFWFSDDSRRIPVRIRTKLKVGEVELNLVKKSP